MQDMRDEVFPVCPMAVWGRPIVIPDKANDMKSQLSRLARLCIVQLATVLAALAADQTTPPFYFTTLAGQASRGSADGTGSAARFCEPYGAAVDAQGNVYVADTQNHTIRRITPAGVVTTFAGLAGEPGATNGTGGAARFNQPLGVAVDASGTVYVADTFNHLIRKITPAGEVTTLAGSAATIGATDGTGTAARFNQPTGVAVTPAGDIIVADSNNSTIRQITPTGSVTTVAGLAGQSGSDDGTGSAARFYQPMSVAVDAAGNIFVADTNNFTIRRISTAAVVTTVAGSVGKTGSADGVGSAARFFGPRGVAAGPAGQILVADLFNCAVRSIAPDGTVTTLAGKAGGPIGWADGTGANAQFGYLAGVAADRNGNAYVVDIWHNTVRKITPAAVVTTLAGNGDSIGSADGPADKARFYYPSGVAVDGAGAVYVVDRLNYTIRRISSAGIVSTLAGKAGKSAYVDGTGSAARFFVPESVAVDSAGNVYVTEPRNHTIRKITPAGVVSTFAGAIDVSGSADGTGAAARFNFPYGLAIDGADNLYVADRYNCMIRKITPAGVVTTLAGSPNINGYADGTGAAAQFSGPEGVAVDKAGNVYVADYYNCTIRKITSAGVVTTLAGMPKVSGFTDGTGSEARFNSPTSVAVDDDGNVYVVDTLNHTFRRITPAGEVTTLAGSAETEGSSNDGLGKAVRFFQPTSLAMTRTGFAYVADTYNNTIRQGQLAGPPVATSQPKSQAVAAGATVQFSVTALAVPAPTYQWYVNGSAFSGATNSTLSIANVRNSDAGDYAVAITNPLGSITSEKATLTVTAISAPPPSTGSGGGGAPSSWFLSALIALGIARRWLK